MSYWGLSFDERFGVDKLQQSTLLEEGNFSLHDQAFVTNFTQETSEESDCFPFNVISDGHRMTAHWWCATVGLCDDAQHIPDKASVTPWTVQT
jgi:hypothetical protein